MHAMPSLWAITDELEEVTAEIMESGGEITPEIEQKLDALEGSFLQKVENIALRVRELVVMADAAKAEKARLTAIEKAYRGAATGLKTYLLANLERKGQDYVQTPKARVRRTRNSQPTIRWTGPQFMIPEGYRRMKIELDNATVREDLEVGRTPPEGVEVEYGHHVRIS